jgi:hypothetical protein
MISKREELTKTLELKLEELQEQKEILSLAYHRDSGGVVSDPLLYSKIFKLEDEILRLSIALNRTEKK